MTDLVPDLVIPARFNGPAGSANGGYTSGTVARLLAGDRPSAEPAEVRLRRPPPLDRPLRWDGTRLLAGDDDSSGGEVVAEGAVAPDAGPPAGRPEGVSLDEAIAASRGYPGFGEHPFPTCFGCGPQRAEGDGLRVFAGPVEGRDAVASPWAPHESVLEGGEVPVPVAWAALDCAGGWAGLSRVEGTYVLGTMRGALPGRAVPGRPHVVVGWLVGAEGRKLRCGSALTTADGDLVGWSDQTWIRVS